MIKVEISQVKSEKIVIKIDIISMVDILLCLTQHIIVSNPSVEKHANLIIWKFNVQMPATILCALFY